MSLAMSATDTETVIASHPTTIRNHPEVIDVDALDEGEQADVEFSGFQRRSTASNSRAVRQSLAMDGLVYMGFRRGVGRSHTPTSAPGGSSNATASGSRSISEEVIVVESDEEEGGSSSTLSARRRMSRNHARLISPPPPPPERGHTPAVPPLPRHLSPQQSLPFSRRPRHHHPPADVPPPIILPSARPLPFEARMASLPRLPPRGSVPPDPVPAPRSHHRPTMGFGGALIALNRQNALEEANRRDREVARNTFNLPSFTEIYRRLSSYRSNFAALDATNTGPGESRWTRLWSWTAGAGVRNTDPLFGDEDLFDFDNAFEFEHYGFPEDFAGRKAPEKAVHWRPEYTHPEKPGPGFTCDFSPADSSSSGVSSPDVIVLDDDKAGSSSAASSSSAPELETTLVCARCLDPLILAPPDGAPEEEKKNRVWALRCGHMLDGKCISHLIAPPPPEPVEPPLEVPSEGKGKGKARAVDEMASAQDQPLAAGVSDAQSAEVPVPTPDRKRKRKAVEALEPESPKRTALADPADEGKTYRSRLRSHARAAADATAPADGTLGSSSSSRPPSSHSRRSGRQGPVGTSTASASPASLRSHAKGKGKARARGEQKPVVEAEHEWRCPMATCGRVHYSVRVRGEWKNDEGRGGIALFL